jgi:hypothetical protein
MRKDSGRGSGERGRIPKRKVERKKVNIKREKNAADK